MNFRTLLGSNVRNCEFDGDDDSDYLCVGLLFTLVMSKYLGFINFGAYVKALRKVGWIKRNAVSVS